MLLILRSFVCLQLPGILTCLDYVHVPSVTRECRDALLKKECDFNNAISCLSSLREKTIYRLSVILM